MSFFSVVVLLSLGHEGGSSQLRHHVGVGGHSTGIIGTMFASPVSRGEMYPGTKGFEAKASGFTIHGQAVQRAEHLFERIRHEKEEQAGRWRSKPKEKTCPKAWIVS